MYLQQNGMIATGDTALDTDLRDLGIVSLASGTYVYASNGRNGGLVSWRLEEGSAPTEVDRVYFSGSVSGAIDGVAECLVIDGQMQLVVGAADGTSLLGYRLTENGDFAERLQTPLALDKSASIASIASVETTGEGSVLYVVDRQTGQLSGYNSETDGAFDLMNGSGPDSFTGAGHLVKVTHGGQDYLLASDTSNQGVVSYRISETTGQLTYAGTMGAGQGLGVNTPTAMELAQAFGETWIFLGASNSNSISVMRLDRFGNLIPTDHLIDTLHTRFGGVQSLAVAQHGDRVFVVAGGADDGLSLFTLLPDGRLLHLQTLPHVYGAGLMNVGQLSAAVLGDEIQVFVASGVSGGMAQYSLSLSGLGDVLRDESTGSIRLTGGDNNDMIVGHEGGTDTLEGGAGDDVLVAGRSNSVMTGGTGADRFVLQNGAFHTRITDFMPHVDQIDISDFPMLRSTGQLSVATTSWGARITFRDAVIEVVSGHGGPLSVADLFGSAFSWPDRVFVLPEQAGALVGTVGNDQLTGGAEDDSIYGDAGADTLAGNGGNDRIWGEEGNDLLFGGDGDDSLQGDDGNDEAWGGAGDDTVLGGAGDDTIGGGVSGDDQLIAGTGNDEVWGGVGNDSIWGQAGADTLGGDHGDDQLWGEAGDDHVWGAAGNDTLEGGDGNDLMGGAEGSDLLHGGNGDDTLGGGGGNDTLDGGNDNDLLNGRWGHDRLVGNQGRDTLNGDEGNDTLLGGEGADSIFGGSGDNSIDGGVGNDTAWGGGGRDTITGGDDNDFLGGGWNDDLLSGGDGADTLIGGNGSDDLRGESGEDFIRGDLGNDTLSGGMGNDTLLGGDGDDTVSGGSGHDEAWGGSGHDQFAGGDGNDTMGGGDGADTIQGEAGNDEAWGGNGNDRLEGAAGHDTMGGGDGDDYVSGGEDNDEVSGGGGQDTVFGGVGNDTLWGGYGHDTLFGETGDDLLGGGEGNDSVYGQSGDDIVRGGGGTDWLNGGTGNDTLTGGGGPDVFYFNETSGNDRITDFTADVDRVHIAGTSLTFDTLNMVQSQDDVLIQFGSAQITLENTLLSSLDAFDFLFF